ncbi:Fatty acid desaturase [Planctomycetes bacterium Pan216]|uniref:Fatty acid desaturase n=1 Tax=Kolteria novifilia TaxID=2527975 RepID=A0A518B0X3_9BACT|nr:Fatty acid desaturase [Planctomycetes bacterium Pan216]
MSTTETSSAGTPETCSPSPPARLVPGALPLPESAAKKKIFWPYVTFFVLMHALVPFAFLPYFFSWVGIPLVLVGNYIFGSIGINIAYHRLLTHRSFQCPRWFEHCLALIGVCSLQDSPGRWVAIHRMHHKHSDEQPDPHSPWVTFFWGHMGWLVVENEDLNHLSTFEQYARDVFRDRFYLKLHRGNLWLWIYWGHALAFLLAGFLTGYLLTGTMAGTLHWGGIIFLWGVVVRTVYVWHITWAVNSAAHRWGYRNYETGEESRNNWWVALLTNGEGWHNNHHADQRSAAHGHRWWEYDLSYWTIKLFEKLGLAWDIAPIRVKRDDDPVKAS